MNREETKEAIEVMQAYAEGKDIEFICFRGSVDTWILCHYGPLWDWNRYKYRIAVTPDVHQWDLYPDWAMYAARDYFGEMQLHQKEPIRVGEKYWGTGKRGHELKITGLKTYTQGTCDWKDSKQKRPEGM